MAWKETRVVDQRQEFVRIAMSSELSMSEACRQFEISRKTGYKWLRRFLEFGESGLEDRSSAPHGSYRNTHPEIVEAVLAARRRFPFWGPRKLKTWLERERAGPTWPAASTIGELLKKHGLVESRRRRNRVPPFTQPLAHADVPNRLWAADFKGQFKVAGRYCYPLTMADQRSRYLLCCAALSSVKARETRPACESTFRRYGLPERIRTDNGPPFASLSPGGLSALSIWWIKLGIVPERIEPGHPEQNGRLERMHRTLKRQVQYPPKRSKAAQQRAFNRFRKEYNEERPHEALDQATPAAHYETSPRPWRPPEDPDYPADFQVRQVNASGAISLKCQPIAVGKLLYTEAVGVEEVAEDRWRVWFGPALLGAIVEHPKRRLEFLPHRVRRPPRRT